MSGQGQDATELTDADLRHASAVARHLAAGGELARVEAPFRTRPGEAVFGSLPAAVFTYEGAQVVTPGSTWVAFGNPWMMAGTLAGSALVNRSRRKKAEAAAAVQWREANRGMLHVTDQRLALQGMGGWLDLDYAYVHSAELTALGLIVHFSDWPLIRVSSANAAWTWVVVNWFAFDRAVEIPHPDGAAPPALGS